MITYKGNEERLDGINPYMRWKELDIELVVSKQARMFVYKAIFSIVPFERMNFGDSVFIPLQPKYWHKIKWFTRKDPNIRVMYETSTAPWGMRVWRWTVPEPKLHRPKRRLKLAA